VPGIEQPVRPPRALARSARAERRRHRAEDPVLITGGAGFVGTNLAHRLLSLGRRVIVLDNLSRAGVEENLRWLRATHPRKLQVECADVRDTAAVARAMRGVGQVFHFAAQVAVTTSLGDPVHDFEVNARGTLNVLEAIRAQPVPPPLVFTSTNKVYGGFEDLALQRSGARYEPADESVRCRGIDERRPLDFHSPYGCSKGAADQYVADYARSFGLPTVVFRMSCIYGPHQFGNEDQGWVAHFLICALEGRPLTVYGDGGQVRDILFVNDLVDAFLLAQEQMDELAGGAFNIGGGPTNTISLLELLDLIEELHGERPAVESGEWRTGDQRYYVSDTARFQRMTGWRPRVDVREGVSRLYSWLRAQRSGERVSTPPPFGLSAAAHGSARAASRALTP
jgi:CDP-paratose 2-epimerase